MSIAVYGGSFNPPHIGHCHVAEAVIKHFKPRRFFIIPAGAAPHKDMAAGSPGSEERMELCCRAFGGGESVTVSNMEILREGKSYTADTLRALMERFPGEEIILVMGTDMYMSLESWYDAQFILKSVHICVVRRDEDKESLRRKALEYAKVYRTRSTIVALKPVVASSSDMRELLPKREGVEMLPNGVYEHIISRRLYGAKPNWNWLREKAYSMLKTKRIPHVKGCEEEAVRLA
ncbi:MAG: nicotinate (nicotinamide) nucleotide adenylyltransferase, partial [Oscillospiraceae bacterium]|nr:nicotinate (nicotinamide) nucleotide adenylyltransferase [Oscillospiraceae bacterium]